MAEPRASQAEERANERARAKHRDETQPAESRSFAAGGGSLAEGGRQMAQGGRQMAEQGRRAGREVADAWRQAFDPFLAVQYDMSRFFDDLWRQTLGFRAQPPQGALRPLGHIGAASLFGLPPADMKETPNAHVLSVELPGLAREDVEVSLSGETLVISGHKAEENEDHAATYRVSERRFGRFERAFPLPSDVDREHVSAEFRDGVLKITLPKSESAAPERSRIEVK